MLQIKPTPAYLKVLLCLTLMPAVICLVVSCGSTPKINAPVSDPLEPINRAVYIFNTKLDNYALKPLAKGYKGITPRFVRQGVTNFFSNIGDVTVAANDMLQGQFARGFGDLARIAVNSTLGIGGLLDVATSLDLPKNNEDFGQTLAHWGVPEGPYIVLPLLGPRTLRGTAGLLMDSQIEPLNSLGLRSSVRSKLVSLNVINFRANYLSATSILDRAALDPYTFVRDGYVKRRRRMSRRPGPPAPFAPPVGASEPAMTTSEIPKNAIDNLDEVDEIDQLDEIDELDEIDQMDEPDEIDRLDSFD